MSRKIDSMVLAFCCMVGWIGLEGVSASAQTVQTGRYSYAIHVDDAAKTSKTIVLGQDEPVEKKGPNLFERMKRSIANWVKDPDEEESASSPQGKVRPVTPSAVPTTPPKPVTTNEIRRSTLSDSIPEEPRRNVATERRTVSERRATVERRETPETLSKIQSLAMESDADPVKKDKKIQDRLKDLRQQIFDDIPEARPEHRIDARHLESQAVSRPSPAPISSNASDEFHDASIATRSVPVHSEIVQEKPARYPERRTDLEAAPRVARATPARSRPIQMPQQAPVDYWNTEIEEPQRIPFESRPVPTASSSNVPGNLPPLAGIDVDRSGLASDSPWNRTGVATGTPAHGKPPVSATLRSSRDESTFHRGHSVVRETERVVPAQRDRGPSAPSVSSGIGVRELSSAGKSQRLSLDATGSSRTVTEREKAMLVSPRIEVETEGDSRAVVGHESTYRVRVGNRGGAAADQVTLTVEVPNWIEILPPDVSTGTTATIPKRQNQESRDFVWKISRLEPGAEEQLVLHLVPQERKTVDLRIRYDFYKPTAVAKIVVEEPVLEMELQGPSEVLWSSKVSYKLLVRNTGNGDAEKVKLELLQTGSDMKSCDLPILKAGEEQAIDVDVWTGKQEHIDIHILATGAYELNTEVFKRIVVLRPELTVEVESAETQFVDSPAEFQITVRNDGTAPAENMELLATIPLGARYLSNTAGGQATPQNQVIWKIPSIPVGDKFTASIVCEPKREGICKLDAVLNDQSGLIASCSGSINAEAVADLKMQLENPQGPVEVGQEAVFTIHIVNRGTKTAEDVEVIAAFARGLEPFAIEGANGTMSDGQVVFDKIPAVSPGQTVTLKVKSKADRPGNHRIRTEIICSRVNAHLVYEQATYFYQRSNSKIAGKTTEKRDTATVPPTPLGTLRGETEPQPLRSAPTAAALPEDSSRR